MKEIKLKEFVNKTKNKTTHQISFNLKARKLKEYGVTPEQLLELALSKSKVKFGIKDSQ